eukprot:360650-Chlamydomonas_euryale.AAC.7
MRGPYKQRHTGRPCTAAFRRQARLHTAPSTSHQPPSQLWRGRRSRSACLKRKLWRVVQEVSSASVRDAAPDRQRRARGLGPGAVRGELLGGDLLPEGARRRWRGRRCTAGVRLVSAKQRLPWQSPQRPALVDYPFLHSNAMPFRTLPLVECRAVPCRAMLCDNMPCTELPRTRWQHGGG